ncbi:enoyl-CoA hydratase/isomerase family protein [Zwartia vadi]|uniref:enoyl-CoA hydratase/isomerase family protein n=1 Tax=Zwartia vadi TaxID=3058168 RepID=UPI0025B47668|nr:enoyl-CoA hydratase-related protein [Zwartia vadi]MDN3987130.1 enoyl-CoA hydratase-related protein [Zwartia vadi]
MTQTVLTETKNGVLTLTINRPERRNALDVATYLGLAEQVWAAGTNKEVRAIVLTGANNYFTAGNDLKDFQAPRPDGDSAGIKFLRSLTDCDLPIIAAIEGSAIGIGVTLLQHCDFIYAADNATFKIPFVPLGLCPEGASSMLMAQIVGIRRATDWLLSGRAFTAQEARDARFITDICPAGQTLQTAINQANALASLPPEALQTSKRMLKHSLRPKIHSAFDYEWAHFNERLKSAEAQAAFAAILNKKK